MPNPSAPPHRPADVRVVDRPSQAVALLKEPRLRILEAARDPITAVALAERLDAPRQRIGYHVRQLVEEGLLEEVDASRRGAMVERRVQASAAAYALSPALLGSLAAHATSGDGASAAHLLGAVHRVQREVATALQLAAAGGERVPTLTISSVVRFADAVQRGAFARALVDALTRVVADHSDPESPSGSNAASAGEPFRLTFTLHPSTSDDGGDTPNPGARDATNPTAQGDSHE